MTQRRSEQHATDRHVIDEWQSIARAKAQWEAAIDVMPQLVCLVDAHGAVVRVNRTLETWGLGAVAQVEGLGLHQLLHPGCTEPDCYLERSLGRALPESVQTPVVERVFDRQLQRHLNLQLTRFNAQPSQPLWMLVFEDVAAQVTAERRAATREQKLQLVVEFVSDLIMRQRVDGTLRYLSRASEALLGYVPSQLVGSSLYALLHPDDAEAVRRSHGAFEHDTDVTTVTCRLRKADGDYLWVEISSQMVLSSANARELVSVARDVHLRRREEERAAEYQKRLERAVNRKTRQLGLAIDMLKRKIEVNERDREALVASERRYTMLVDNTLTGIYMSKDDRIEFCNQRFARIFGYRQEAMCGMELSFLGMVRPEDGVEYAMEQDEIVEIVTRSGVKKWLKLSRARFGCGDEIYLLGNVIDITEQVHVFERLKASEHELRMLSAQLIAAQENERKRIANELHDGIGQRLSAIKFTVEDVLRSEADAGHLAQAERLGGIVERIRDSIEEVRRVSMDLRPSILDDLGLIATLGWFCREFGMVYKGMRISKNLTASEEVIPEGLKVVIFRISQEALHNIAKHSNADHIILGLSQDCAGLHLSIHDNGRGFDYAQATATGSGLGLKSMRERAELTDGRFTVESRPRRGTEISVLWQT